MVKPGYVFDGNAILDRRKSALIDVPVADARDLSGYLAASFQGRGRIGQSAGYVPVEP